MHRSSPHDPGRIAAVLAYAEEHGDGEAAKRFKISKRTVWRYRANAKKTPAVAAAVSAATEKVRRAWLDEAGEARSLILGEIKRRVAAPDANLRDIVGALKIVSDSMLAEKVLTEDGGQPDDSAGVEGARGAAATASGLERAPALYQ